MIMIPLPFLISVFAGILLVREIFKGDVRGKINWYLVLFLTLVVIQTLLIGARFGYGLDWLGRIQPFTAALTAPSALLCFWRPSLKVSFCVALMPIVFVIIAYLISLYLVDAALALNNIIFAIALAVLGLKGVEGLGWVGLDKIRSVFIILWSVVVLLLISGITDAIIVWDYWQNAGGNVQKIVGVTFATSILFAGIIYFVWQMQKGKKLVSLVNRNDAEMMHIFERVETLMKEAQVFLDPELTLNRIARKLTMPARDISRAINVITKQNVSQYVNGLRVEVACKKMQQSDASILEILYASGFNTKSNFNREFVRVMEMTPSKWRSREKDLKLYFRIDLN